MLLCIVKNDIPYLKTSFPFIQQCIQNKSSFESQFFVFSPLFFQNKCLEYIINKTISFRLFMKKIREMGEDKQIKYHTESAMEQKGFIRKI